MFAADRRKGLAIVVGKVGTGKTTLAQWLQSQWAKDETKYVGFLPSAKDRTEAAFLREVAKALGLPTKRTASDSKEDIQTFLLQCNAKDVHPVLIIDEGQDIHPNNIDTIAELINFQTAKTKFITVIIFATDNFPNKIVRKDSFRSRIAISVNIDPLSFDETKEMIDHRMKTAGGKNVLHYFTEDALEVVYDVTQGVARDICVLCDNALIDAYVNNVKPVTAEIVAMSVKSLDATKQWRANQQKGVTIEQA